MVEGPVGRIRPSSDLLGFGTRKLDRTNERLIVPSARTVRAESNCRGSHRKLAESFKASEKGLGFRVPFFSDPNPLAEGSGGLQTLIWF